VLAVSASGAIGKINPATLIYVATPVLRVVDTPNPPFAGTVTGFVNGETLASATAGTLVFASDATASSPAGLYAINGSGLTAKAGNYVFVEAPDNATALAIAMSLDFGVGATKILLPDVLAMIPPVPESIAVQHSCTSGAVGQTMEKKGSVVIFAPGGGCS
jgi:trimeric autotransporter adhesin